MKLYSYDHCPYCVKARMIFGLKGIPLEIENLLNDDEETPISMVGKKMVPILVKENGEFLPESMDIVGFCDNLDKFGEPIIGSSQNNEVLNLWLKQTRQYNYALAMPRWVHMGLPEFSTQGAIEYFTDKKIQSIGPFPSNLEITQDLTRMAENHLSELENLIVGKPYFWGEQICEDDIHVFAALRVLTCVKGLIFPPKLKKYSNFLSDRSNVPLHWSQALGEDL